MSIDSSFYLYKVTDEELDAILGLSDSAIDDYIELLIEKFFSTTETETQNKLRQAYKSSFVLEKVIRNSPIISNNFTAIYTKSGLIREVVNDLYSIGSEKLALN
jgi:hypothetical protein